MLMMMNVSLPTFVGDVLSSPMITLATMSCMKRISTLVFEEKPIISHDMMEMTLMLIKVIRRPNLSSTKPDARPPIGEKIAVIEANQLAWETDNLTS